MICGCELAVDVCGRKWLIGPPLSETQRDVDLPENLTVDLSEPEFVMPGPARGTLEKNFVAPPRKGAKPAGYYDIHVAHLRV